VAYSDEETAVKGVMDMLDADSAFTTALGTYQGHSKVERDVISQGVPRPAVAIVSSGFEAGPRPQRQGGKSIQIWSEGIVAAFLATDNDYSPNLERLLIDALDNRSYVTVASAGTIKSIRYLDASKESVNVGDRRYKLAKINFRVLAKAT